VYCVHEYFDDFIDTYVVDNPIKAIVSRFKTYAVSQWDPDTDDESHEFYAIHPTTLSAPLTFDSPAEFTMHLYQMLTQLSPGQKITYRQTRPDQVTTISMDKLGHYGYSYHDNRSSAHIVLSWCRPEPARYHHHISDQGRVTVHPVTDLEQYCIDLLESKWTSSTVVTYQKWDDLMQECRLEAYVVGNSLRRHFEIHFPLLEQDQMMTYRLKDERHPLSDFTFTMKCRDDYMVITRTPTEHFSSLTTIPTP
jgi:hypothetical protein